jgi:hypothetical protein
VGIANVFLFKKGIKVCVCVFYFLKGLKSVDSSIKKESDLPAADPSTPIPLKYEDESTRGGPEGLEKQMALFLDKSKLVGKHLMSSVEQHTPL